MIDNDLPNPGIPEDFAFFFRLVENGEAKRFQDIWNMTIMIDNQQHNGGALLLDLASRYPDFFDAEEIIEGTFLTYGDRPAEQYLIAVKEALLAIWPPKPPQVVNILRQGIGQKRQNIQETGTWSDYQLAINLFPNDVYIQFNALSVIDQDKIQNAFSTITLSLGDALPNNSKAITAAIGKCKGPFNKVLGEAWPGRVTQKKKALPKERTDETTELMETHFVYLAVCDLLDGNFINLDPVIGDEACESRPSLIIDIWEAINTAYLINPDYINCLKYGYKLRHCMDTESTQLKDISQIRTESVWSGEFIDWCMVTLSNIGDWAVNYLKYCKANTLASTMACDEWGIASYDRNKGVYSIEGKAQRRNALSTLSIGRIRALAEYVHGHCQTNRGQMYWGQVLTVLNNVNSFKIDNKSQVFALPIYESMRTVLAYELLKNRPIIFSIYRIQFDPNSSNYTLGNIHTIIYRANEGRLVSIDPNTISQDLPCVSMLAYQIVNSSENIYIGDGENFFSSTGDDYINNFLGCDIALQAMIYAGVHPPLPHGAILNNLDVGQDCGRAQLMEMHQGNMIEAWGNDIDYTRLSQISLLEPECDLGTEYIKLTNLGQRCGLQNKQYMSRPGGGVVCVRTTESCAFTIHHINVQSLRKVQIRNNEALQNATLRRYHNFDRGLSFSTEDEAKN